MKEKIKIYLVNPLQDFFLWLALVTFGRNIKLAKSWNELTEIQLQGVVLALESFHKNKEAHPNSLPQHFSRLYIQLVKQLLRTNNFVKVMIALRQIPPAEYQDHIKFLINGNERTAFPNAFKIKNKLYHPPGPRLNNIQVKEFSYADALFYRWRDLNDQRYLDLLCATLYRTRGSNNEIDIRKEFHKELIENDVKPWAKVRLQKKLAIAYTYEGSRGYMAKQFKNVFPPAAPISEEEKKKPRPKQKYMEFGKLISAKAEYKPHQMTATENLNVYKFLGLFDNELSEAKKIKK